MRCQPDPVELDIVEHGRGATDDGDPAVPLFAESLAAMRETVRSTRPTSSREPAAELPYAQVAADVELSHLDQVFDYLVPAELDAEAQPGVRVRVRFAGQVVDGFVVGRSASSPFEGRFEWLQKVVSPEPVLRPEIVELARTLADRYAGTMADVLRLAVPPRHGRSEQKETEPAPEVPRSAVDAGPWAAYEGGSAFIEALASGTERPRAVWTCLPGTDWTEALAAALVATAAGGRGALAVVPDRRDLDRLDRALDRALREPVPSEPAAHESTDREIESAHSEPAPTTDPRSRPRRATKPPGGSRYHVLLAEDLGPAKRYQNWLAVVRGDIRIAIGTRAAMFAPVHDLGLVAVWDDGDDLHAEPRAPYPHVREVLALRAHQTGAAALVGGYACTAEGAQLVASGWAHPLAAHRDTVRAAMPLIRTSGEEREQDRDAAAAAARLPTLAWRTARAALADGPVLVQVPRGGYAPALACVRCRTHARCTKCHGPLALTSGHAIAHCGWCGRPAGDWRCPGTLDAGTVDERPCGGDRFRLLAVGVQRTAEELGRAFPNVKVISSAQDTVVAEVGPKPALVVATPGAEPVAEGGYAAALLLDGWSLLGRRDLRAGEEALRRWLNAAALVRPHTGGGAVVVMAEPSLAPVQALVRWDPVWHARRELEDRGELHYPPLARVAELTGTPAAVAEELSLLHLPETAEVLGPVVVDAPWADAAPGETHRALVRVPRRLGAELAEAVREAQGVRSARKAEDWVRVRMDPMQIG